MFLPGRYLTGAVVCVVLLVLGCTKTSDPLPAGSDTLPTDGPSTRASEPGESTSEQGTQGSPSDGAGAATAGHVKSSPTQTPVAPEVEVPSVKLAEVKLSEVHAKLCAVKVGDTMPEIKLPDLSGNPTQLASLYGEKLTVVVFWSGNVAPAREELADLGPDVAVPHSGQGLKVVGIAVGETAESAQGRLEDAEAMYPNLIDTEGLAFSKVGTEKLPRTFLLDAQGKILWFDIEYSRSTRRELRDGIAFTLGESP